jgi:hypothetical protein
MTNDYATGLTRAAAFIAAKYDYSLGLSRDRDPERRPGPRQRGVRTRRGADRSLQRHQHPRTGSMTTTQSRIARGIDLLDQGAREDWRKLIDLDNLDMSAGAGPCGCILSQVYGTYGKGLSALGPLEEDQAFLDSDFGYPPTIVAHGFEKTADMDYCDLTDAWKEALS